MEDFMKKLLTLLLIITMIAAMTACDTKKTEEPDIETVSEIEDVLTEPVTIEYWYCFTDTVAQFNIDKSDEFNKTVGQELGITVNAVNQQDYSTVAQKLQAAAVAGATPEVVLMGVDQTPFVRDGVLLSLDGYIQRDKVDITDFYEGFLEQSYYNGKLYSMPFFKSTAVIIYNKTMFDAANLDSKDMVTWDDFAAFATTLHEKIGVNGVTTFAWPWILESYLLSYNSGFHSSSNASNINSDITKDFVKMFLDLKQSEVARIIPQAENNAIYGEFATGKTAMIPHSTGAIVSLAGMGTKYGFEVGVAFMPKGDVNATVTGGGNLAVTTKTSDAAKEAAWQFVKFMTNTENSVDATIATGYLPTRKSGISAAKLTEFVKKVPQMQIAINQLENAKTPTNIGNEETRAISVAIESIWISDTDLNTTLQEAETKINNILNEAN